MTDQEARILVETLITEPSIKVIDPRGGPPCRIIRVDRDASTGEITIHYLPNRMVTPPRLDEPAPRRPERPSLGDF